MTKILNEVMEIEEFPKDLREKWEDYVVPLVSDLSKEPEEIYQELRLGIKQYMEEE